MATQGKRFLGILDFEREPGWVRPKPLPGSLMSPDTYGVPVVVEGVRGSTVNRTMSGDPTLAASYVDAAQRLASEGALAIGSNCGFAIRYQEAVSAAVKIPVMMSALVLLPSLLRQYPRSAQIGVVTSDSTLFADDLLGISDPVERTRVIVGGIEGGNLSRNSALGKPTSSAEMEADVSACIIQMIAANPRLSALLFTCTLFPIISPALRRKFGLPIFDISTACRLALESAVSAGLVHAENGLAS